VIELNATGDGGGRKVQSGLLKLVEVLYSYRSVMFSFFWYVQVQGQGVGTACE
jgi:hypothetical protein